MCLSVEVNLYMFRHKFGLSDFRVLVYQAAVSSTCLLILLKTSVVLGRVLLSSRRVSPLSLGSRCVSQLRSELSFRSVLF